MSGNTKVADFSSYSQATDEIYTKEEKVTPEIAKQWLTMNRHNRPISKPYCKDLARDMEDGRWHVNGESIKFDNQGFLIDGQHRLRAVILSGCTINTCVTYNIYDSEAFKYLDEGRKRTAADYIAAIGYENYTQMASGANLVHHIVHFANLKQLKIYRKRTHNCDIADFAEELGEIHEAIIHSSTLSQISTRAVMTAVSVIFLRIDQGRARQFLEKLETGMFTQLNDPVRVLRDQMLSRNNPIRACETLECLALIFKAWNLSCKDKTCKRLVWRQHTDSQEDFPIPAGFEQAWKIEA